MSYCYHHKARNTKTKWLQEFEIQQLQKTKPSPSIKAYKLPENVPPILKSMYYRPKTSHQPPQLKSMVSPIETQRELVRSRGLIQSISHSDARVNGVGYSGGHVGRALNDRKASFDFGRKLTYESKPYNCHVTMKDTLSFRSKSPVSKPIWNDCLASSNDKNRSRKVKSSHCDKLTAIFHPSSIRKLVTKMARKIIDTSMYVLPDHLAPQEMVIWININKILRAIKREITLKLLESIFDSAKYYSPPSPPCEEIKFVFCYLCVIIGGYGKWTAEVVQFLNEKASLMLHLFKNLDVTSLPIENIVAAVDFKDSHPLLGQSWKRVRRQLPAENELLSLLKWVHYQNQLFKLIILSHERYKSSLVTDSMAKSAPALLVKGQSASSFHLPKKKTTLHELFEASVGSSEMDVFQKSLGDFSSTSIDESTDDIGSWQLIETEPVQKSHGDEEHEATYDYHNQIFKQRQASSRKLCNDIWAPSKIEMESYGSELFAPEPEYVTYCHINSRRAASVRLYEVYEEDEAIEESEEDQEDGMQYPTLKHSPSSNHSIHSPQTIHSPSHSVVQEAIEDSAEEKSTEPPVSLANAEETNTNVDSQENNHID